MKGAERKAALAAYKEMKSPAGVYAVRCTASGQAWVGKSLDVSKIQNRLWFALRLGGDPNLGLRAAWQAHGAEAFTFEAVEILADDLGPARDRVMKERLAYWRETLGAEVLV